MNVANVKILYTGENAAEADALLFALCSQHLIAGACTYNVSTCIWIGGQLTKGNGIIIEGITRPEYVNKISKYLKDKDAVLKFVSVNDVTDENFIKWFESHL